MCGNVISVDRRHDIKSTGAVAIESDRGKARRYCGALCADGSGHEWPLPSATGAVTHGPLPLHQ